MTEYDEKVNELVKLMESQGQTYDLKLVEKAFRCAVAAHKGQHRQSGEEY